MGAPLDLNKLVTSGILSVLEETAEDRTARLAAEQEERTARLAREKAEYSHRLAIEKAVMGGLALVLLASGVIMVFSPVEKVQAVGGNIVTLIIGGFIGFTTGKSPTAPPKA